MDTKKLMLVGVLGVVAVGAFIQLQKLSTPPPAAPVQAAAPQQIVAEVDFVKVLTAALDIPMGSRVTPEHMQWTKWPKDALIDSENLRLIVDETRPGAMDELNTAVARTAIYAGEPIVQRKVVLSGERGQMSALLKPGLRAIATRVSVDSAAGGFIKPGDRVDIVMTVQIKNDAQVGNGQNYYVSNTIFENVHVLAIDQVYGDGPDGAAVVGSTALLELSQEDAEILIEAQSTGDLSMTLRGLENRRVSFVPSAATVDRKDTGSVSSMTIYRDGRSQQVAIQGQ